MSALQGAVESTAPVSRLHEHRPLQQGNKILQAHEMTGLPDDFITHSKAEGHQERIRHQTENQHASRRNQDIS